MKLSNNDFKYIYIYIYIQFFLFLLKKEFRIEEPDEQSQLETSIQQPLFLVEEVSD